MPDFVTKCISVTDDSFQKFFYSVTIVPCRPLFSYWSGVVGVVFLLLHCSHLLNFIFECAGGTNIFVLGCALRTTPSAPHRGYPRPPTLPTARPGFLPIKKIDPRPFLDAIQQPFPVFRFPTTGNLKPHLFR